MCRDHSQTTARARWDTRVASLVGVDRREVGTFGRDASSSMSARDDDDCVCFDDDDDHRDDGGVAGGRKRGREREVVF
jgi:hypothetical protein